MTLVHWEPARLFSTLFDSPTAASTAYPTRVARRWVPSMDLVEADDHYVLTADLPGLGRDDVAIEVEDQVLTISGERQAAQPTGEGRYLRVERAAGQFRRSLTLPEGIDAERIAASFDNGVLSVSIPKPELRKPRRVEISVAGATPAVVEGDAS